MTKAKHSWKRKVLEVLALAVAVPLFFLLLVTVVDKIAYGGDKFKEEVSTYTITVNGMDYEIPDSVPGNFTSWPLSAQKTSNPDYGIIRWGGDSTTDGVRFTVLIHIPSGAIKVGTIGLQDYDASFWWIWEDDGKVYLVDDETGREHVRHLLSLITC